MTSRNKVVWSDGLFLRPQHFQQQERYLEGLVDGRHSGVGAHTWGFKELVLATELYGLGRVGVERARGVLPDGTPFRIPEEVEAPVPVKIPNGAQWLTVHLGLPLPREDVPEVTGPDDPAEHARYCTHDVPVPDSGSQGDGRASITVGRPRIQLLLESQGLGGYASMPVLRVEQAQADQVVPDERFIPPVVDCQAAEGLRKYLKEIYGLLRSQGRQLSSEFRGSLNVGGADLDDLMLLQVVNRFEPLMSHFAGLPGLHPERFFEAAVSLAGELTTFTKERRPPVFDAYRHVDLEDTFDPVVRSIRISLAPTRARRAERLPLVESDMRGIRSWTIDRRELIDEASFWVAVHGALNDRDVQEKFETLSKIASTEQVNDLIRRSTDGIDRRHHTLPDEAIRPLRGYQYFELDRRHPLWGSLREAAGLAIFVPDEAIPELDVQLWAVRDDG